MATLALLHSCSATKGTQSLQQLRTSALTCTQHMHVAADADACRFALALLYAWSAATEC